MFKAQAALSAHQWLQRQGAAIGQGQLGGLGDGFVQGAQAHVQTGQAEDLHQTRHIGEVEAVAGVLFGDQQ